MGLAACATAPRFSPAIEASFAHQPMRHLETAELELYYPASAADEANRFAARLTHCLQKLRTLPLSKTPRAKLLLYLTSANFNNAYVQPQIAGMPQQMVVPLHETDELFNLIIEPGAEVADVSCHEAVHYVQMQQVDGLWRAVNLALGDVLEPNIFTESWFLEGLAVHYEGRLDKDVGRPWNPIWHGVFESGAAANHGQMNAGYLDARHRDASPFGGSYLVGEQFVDFLAERYGEEKLWQLVDLQGRSWFSPFGVTLRFKAIYGKSIGALFDDFTAHLARVQRERPRPPDQKTLQDGLGSFARIASAPDGTLAILSAPRDGPVLLTVRGPDDAVRLEEPLRPLLPERPFIAGHPLSVSGLSFSADGRWLYVVIADVGQAGDDDNVLVELDAHTGEVRRTWSGLEGLGGTVTPDGQDYLFTHLDQDIANLFRLHLDSGRREPLTHATTHQSLGTATISPSGKRIAFPRWQGAGFDLVVLEDGVERQVTHDARFNQSPRFVDEDHVVLLRDEGGHAQAEVVELSSGALRRVTDAPFVAFDPAPRPGNRLAFVNREGWSWTLDEVPLDGAWPQTESPRTIAAPVPAVTASSESQVTLLRDEPYRALDHLFIPTLRSPLVGFQSSGARVAVLLGVSLEGSDRLGMHSYLASLAANLATGSNVEGVTYLNEQLAPVELALTLGHARDLDATDDLEASLGISRTFWTTPVSFDVELLRRRTPDFADTLFAPRLSAFYAATDGSVYGGTQRGFTASLSMQAFPEALGNDFDFADLRGAVRVWLPQPIPRGSLSIAGVGRALPGAPKTLLRVGGELPWAVLVDSEPSRDDGHRSLSLPTGVSFSEGLRGYEDFRLHGNIAVIGGADYHYPLILDHGWASTLYLGPPLFIRQIDLSAFARWARVDAERTTVHRVVGGSVSVQLSTSLSAPTFFYSFAQRFDDGLGPLHLVGIGF